ncbi:MAG TPA: hypothetical protein VIK61_07690, partial [Acidimicrobiia bacterium]
MINRAPTVFVRFGVERLGTGDKPSLITGTIVLSLLIGAMAGVYARRRRIVGDATFAAFAVLGFVAANDLSGASVFAVGFAAVCAALAGAAALRMMLRWAARPEPERPSAAARGTTRTAPAPMSSRRRFLVLSGGFAAAAAVSGNLGRLLL